MNNHNCDDGLLKVTRSTEPEENHPFPFYDFSYMGVFGQFYLESANEVSIYMIESRNKLKGETKSCIKALKSKFQNVDACSVYDDDERVEEFWRHMIKIGLIRNAYTMDCRNLKHM